MVSEWRVVEASTTGTIDAYLVEDYILLYTKYNILRSK